MYLHALLLHVHIFTCTEALFITCIEALLLHVNVFTCFIITCTRIYMY